MLLQAGCANYRVDPPSPWNYVVYLRSCVISWVADFANILQERFVLSTVYTVNSTQLYKSSVVLLLPPDQKKRIQTVYVHLFTYFFAVEYYTVCSSLRHCDNGLLNSLFCEKLGYDTSDDAKTEREFYTFKEHKNRFQGTDSALLCSLAGRFDNHIPTRFLAT